MLQAPLITLGLFTIWRFGCILFHRPGSVVSVLEDAIPGCVPSILSAAPVCEPRARRFPARRLKGEIKSFQEMFQQNKSDTLPLSPTLHPPHPPSL